MFVKDEAEVSSKMGGVNWKDVYFQVRTFLSLMSKNLRVLEELRVRRLAVDQEKIVLKSVLKVRNAWVKVEWVEREESRVSSA